MSRVKTISYRDLINYALNRQIHNLFRYPAKLIPEIPLAFLNDEFVSDSGVILDPFCGSGTVMVEAQRLGYESIGIDINPLCYLISKVKTTPLNWSHITRKAQKFDNEIKEIKPIEIDFKNKDYWFNETITNALAKIINWVNAIEQPDSKDFFRFVFASIIRRVSNADVEIFPPVMSAERKEELRLKDLHWVNNLFKNQASYAAKVLKNHFDQIADPPEVKCILGSSTEKHLEEESIDLILTSPPYINAQKYIRTTKFELFWLGEITNDTIAELDKKVVGTERISMREFNPDNARETFWWSEVRRLLKVDKWRAQIVHEYFVNMKKVLELCYAYLKKEGHFVLVIGNNTIRNRKIRNDMILKQMAEEIGFEYDNQNSMRDKIKKRSLPEQRNKTAGVMDYEYIMVFKKT